MPDCTCGAKHSADCLIFWTPAPREMVIGDIAEPMMWGFGPGWTPPWTNPPREWFPTLPPRRRVKPW